MHPFRICSLLGTAPTGKARGCGSDKDTASCCSAKVADCVSMVLLQTWHLTLVERIGAARGIRVILNMGEETWVNVRGWTMSLQQYSSLCFDPEGRRGGFKIYTSTKVEAPSASSLPFSSQITCPRRQARRSQLRVTQFGPSAKWDAATHNQCSVSKTTSNISRAAWVT